MAKMIRHDFGGIHDALNKMIVAEVKAALELLPEKCIREEGAALCRIIVGPVSDYSPRNIAVDEVWVDEKDGLLHIYGRDVTVEACGLDPNVADNVEPDEWTEQDDLYDITDFAYLIDQIAEKVEGEHDIRMKERGNLFYSERKIGDKVRWICPDGVEVETYITGILAEQESGEPEEIIYTSNLLRGNKLHTVYLTENAILND